MTPPTQRPRLVLHLKEKRITVVADAICEPSEENDWMYVLKLKGKTVGKFDVKSIIGWHIPG